MADWALIEGQRSETAGTVSATSISTAITAGSANTKGSYAQLIASTGFDAKAILLQVGETTFGTTSDFYVDLAVGAAASEQIIIPDWFHGRIGNFSDTVFLPISIPAGSRLAARNQSNTASATVNINVVLLAQGFLPSQPLSQMTTYGLAATTRGTAVDGGASANTKGAWAEVTSSTTSPIRMLYMNFSGGRITRSGTSNFLFDIGIGAGGSETVLIADLQTRADSNTDFPVPFMMGPIPVNIPAGTRVALRTQCSVNTAGERAFDVVMHGLN